MVSVAVAASERVRSIKVRNTDVCLSVCSITEQRPVSALFHRSSSPSDQCAPVKSMTEPIARASHFILEYHVLLCLTASFQKKTISRSGWLFWGF